MQIHRILLLAALALGVTQSAAFGALIGINFNKSGAAGNLAGSDLAGAPGFEQINWQNVSANATNLTLTDSSGAATTATMTASGTFGSFVLSPSGTDEKLNDGWITSANPSSTPTTITLSNIPYASYSIVVYTLASSIFGPRSTTVGGTTYFLVGPSSESQSGYLDGNSSTPYTYIQGTSTSSGSPTPNGDYVVFTNLTGSSQTITSATIPSGGDAPVEGFQIVQIVPEPASVALIALGIPALLGLRRRRRC